MSKIAGRAEFAAKLGRVGGPAKIAKIGRALFAAGNLIETEAALSIEKGSQSGKNHVPSKPGEPPNSDTQFLARSITTVSVAPLKVEVGTSASYAAALEFGTSRMAARPFMRPALAQNREKAAGLIRGAVHEVLRGD